MIEPEPMPRGTAQWYEWAMKYPGCCNCTRHEDVQYIEVRDGGGWFCPECMPRAQEIIDAMVD